MADPWRGEDTMLHVWGDNGMTATPPPVTSIPDPGFPEPEVPMDWTGGGIVNDSSTPYNPIDYSPIPTMPDPSFTGLDTVTPGSDIIPTGGNWWDGLGDTASGVAKGFMDGMGKLWDPKLLMFPAAFASAYKQWQDAEKYRDVAQGAADRSINTAQGASDYSRGTSQGIADLARGVAGGIAGSAQGTAGAVSDFARGDAQGIAGSARGAAQDALQYGDPFGPANRGYYQDALRMAYEHPEQVLNDPAHQATLQSGFDQISRTNASKGYLGSGNMEADLMKFAANENAKYLDSYRAGLVPLTGSQFNPASAGNFLMQGEDLAGRSIMQGNDLAGRSLMQGEDLAGRSLMQGEDLAGRSLMTGAGQSGGYLMSGAQDANNALFKGNDQAIQSQNAALQALMYPFMNSAAGNTINNQATGGQGSSGGSGRTNSNPSTDADLVRAVMSGNKDVINKAIDSGMRFVKLPDGSTADLWAMARSGYQTGAPGDPGVEVGYTPGRDTYGYGSQEPQGPGDVFPPEGPPSWAAGEGSGAHGLGSVDVSPITDVTDTPIPDVPVDDWNWDIFDGWDP